MTTEDTQQANKFLTVSGEIASEIEVLAERERRSFAGQANVLLSEALAARKHLEESPPSVTCSSGQCPASLSDTDSIVQPAASGGNGV